MRTDQIEYLEEVKRVNSMNKASKNLCISVQALSASMKNLEDELGFQVLDTTYKGTHLTDKGEKFLEAGLQFLDKIYELQGGRPERRAISGIWPIYCVPGVIDTILPDFLMEFQKYHPNAELEAVPVFYQDVFAGLLEKDFDYTFVFSPVIDGESLINWEERFEFVPLKKFKFYCEINRKLNIASQKVISMKTLMEYDIVAWEPTVYPMFSTSAIFKKIDPKKKIQLIKHKSLYEKTLSEKPVATLNISASKNLSERPNVNGVSLSDKNIWVNFGYVKLKNKVLCQQSQWATDMMNEYLGTLY